MKLTGVFLSTVACLSAQTFTTIYDFSASSIGLGDTAAGLTPGRNGKFYGTSTQSGRSGCGAVFELTPPAQSGGAWTVSTLYEFAGNNDGCHPLAGVVLGANGRLYGTTTNAGSAQFGTVFELKPPASPGGGWIETTLHSFLGGTDGRIGNALTLGKNGKLYGTTYWGGQTAQSRIICLSNPGCGTVFEMTPPSSPGGTWTETVIYRFLGAEGDGILPDAGVTVAPDGTLYGTTVSGGKKNAGCVSNHCGVVFSLQPPSAPGGKWTETVLYEFRGGTADGSEPYAAVVLGANGELYGTTFAGGNPTCFYGCGIVFELQPPAAGGAAWTESVLHFFTAGSDGDSPIAGVTLGAGGQLFGVTFSGGISPNCSNQCGVLFELTPPGRPAAPGRKRSRIPFKAAMVWLRRAIWC